MKRTPPHPLTRHDVYACLQDGESTRTTFARCVSRVAVYCEANPQATHYATRFTDTVRLPGGQFMGNEKGFTWDFGRNEFYTDSPGLICHILGSLFNCTKEDFDAIRASPAGAAPCERFQDALLQLHSYVHTDAGRSEEGRLGTRSDERVYGYRQSQSQPHCNALLTPTPTPLCRWHHATDRISQKHVPILLGRMPSSRPQHTRESVGERQPFPDPNPRRDSPG